ncbi:MAG: 3-oxoacyl-ACP reductase FabG [Clostridia bacterium]|nr:3-oxoacyl-ACP reductase FabG [Clostridia bacterium]
MKTVIITGAARGIGAACALMFAANGYDTVINYNTSKKEADELCRRINSSGGRAIAVGADVSVMSEAEKLFSAAGEEFGTADVLINNAGVAQQKLFTDITQGDYDRMFDCNVRSAFNCSQLALKSMIKNKYGRIINISSMWGISGASCEVHYSASKAAVIGFTKALAKEVAPSGVTVNCIAPGVIDTRMNACFDGETMRALAEETPAGRLGKPEDVAGAALFFAGRDSGFITGQVLCVDGGFI